MQQQIDNMDTLKLLRENPAQLQLQQYSGLSKIFPPPKKKKGFGQFDIFGGALTPNVGLHGFGTKYDTGPSTDNAQIPFPYRSPFPKASDGSNNVPFDVWLKMMQGMIDDGSKQQKPNP